MLGIEGKSGPIVKPWLSMSTSVYCHQNAHVEKVKNDLSSSMSRSFRGHNVAYKCKGVDQSNTVCEYEVNLSTNEKVITEKQYYNTKC